MCHLERSSLISTHLRNKQKNPPGIFHICNNSFDAIKLQSFVTWVPSFLSHFRVVFFQHNISAVSHYCRIFNSKDFYQDDTETPRLLCYCYRGYMVFYGESEFPPP